MGWFEIISENYLLTKGYPLEHLEEIRAHYPIAMHGVSLSIGGSLNFDYLKELKNLIHWLQPIRVSDHFCFIGLGGHNSHELLPLPYTKKMKAHLIENISRVQDFLGRQLSLENPSQYLFFPNNELEEIDFIHEVLREAGAKWLLDLNNIYVSGTNGNWDIDLYLEKIDFSLVEQVHLAGHEEFADHLFDSHSRAIQEPLENIIEKLRDKIRGLPVMIEWDEDIPEFPLLYAELKKVEELLWSREQFSPVGKEDGTARANF